MAAIAGFDGARCAVRQAFTAQPVSNSPVTTHSTISSCFVSLFTATM